MARVNPIRPWAHWPLPVLIAVLGVVGTSAAVILVTVVYAAAGVDTYGIGFVLLFASMFGAPLGVVCTVAALIGGWVGGRFGRVGEIVGMAVATLAVTAVTSVWVSGLFAYFAPYFIGGGLVATVGFCLATSLYRAIPPETAESKRARKLAAQLAAGEGES